MVMVTRDWLYVVDVRAMILRSMAALVKLII
jgi:hypothetical protein